MFLRGRVNTSPFFKFKIMKHYLGQLLKNCLAGAESYHTFINRLLEQVESKYKEDYNIEDCYDELTSIIEENNVVIADQTIHLIRASISFSVKAKLNTISPLPIKKKSKQCNQYSEELQAIELMKGY